MIYSQIIEKGKQHFTDIYKKKTRALGDWLLRTEEKNRNYTD